MKRLLCVCFSLVLLISLPFHAFASAALTENSSSNDSVEVVDLGDQHEIIYYGGTTIEDITTEDYRKIITQSGADTSVYYEDFSTGVAILSVNGLIVETYNMEQLRNDYYVWSMPEEDKELLTEYLSNQIEEGKITLPAALQNKYTVTYNNLGDAIISPTTGSKTYSVRTTYTPVRPTGPVTNTYPEYTYKEVATRLRYSSLCGRYLDMAIKDSMYNYIQIEKQSYTYVAQTAVSVIAGALQIKSSTLLEILDIFISVIDGVLKLTTNIEFYTSEEYTFSALRQVYVYDYTNYNRDVSVKTYYGGGEIALIWDFSGNEYIDPAYRISSIAYPHTLDYSDLYDEAQEIWEYNMDMYGYWRWGDV